MVANARRFHSVRLPHAGQLPWKILVLLVWIATTALLHDGPNSGVLLVGVTGFPTVQPRIVRSGLTLSATPDELRASAERLRLQVKELEDTHLRDKLQQVQRQLRTKPNLNAIERDALQQQEESLLKRMGFPSSSSNHTASSGSKEADTKDSVSRSSTTTPRESKPVSAATTERYIESTVATPYTPFPKQDMELILSLAETGDWNSNITMDIDTVRAFEMEVSRQRLNRLFQRPVQQWQEQEAIKQSYMKSTSSIEKQQLKRQWDQLSVPQAEHTVLPRPNAPIQPLSERDMEDRICKVQQLSPIAQALFRYLYTGKADDTCFTTPLSLQILLQHYTPVLETVAKDPSAWDDLPVPLQEHFGNSIEQFRKTYVSPVSFDTDEINVVFQPSNQPLADSSQSLEYIDRSRYLKEFYPIEQDVAAMIIDPKKEEQELNAYLQGISFTGRDPVLGGYFLRGASETVIHRLQQRSSTFSSYWIPDPSPLTDEMIESGSDAEPVVFITKQSFDRVGKPLVQVAVSILALLTTAVFALFGANNTVDAVVTANLDDIALVAGGLVAIQAVHELGHRAVAWKDSLDIGWPTLIPSPVVGLQGAITALRSSPPDFKSLFDFSMAGPLSGLLLSILMLLQGLEWTAASYWTASTSTSLPVSLLHASQLGGFLVEFFLGNGMLSVEQVSRIALHPVAIAGYCGLLINSAALLPIGNTDGGRISIALFGRRGAYIVSKFTTVLMCLSGFIGLDDSGFLLTYALYCVIWQKNMELPIQDEVTKLDAPRAMLGFLVAPIVVVALLPAV